MARGVATEFLDILESDRKVAWRRVILLSVVAVLLAGPAWWVAGLVGVAIHAGATILAVVAGFFLSRMRYEGRYTVGLMEGWSDWMEQSVRSESVPEVARRVARRSGRNRPLWYALAFTALWAAELALLMVAFREDVGALSAYPVLAFNALAVGGFIGLHIRGARWSSTLEGSLDEMVQDGEIGVLGAR